MAFGVTGLEMDKYERHIREENLLYKINAHEITSNEECKREERSKMT